MNSVILIGRLTKDVELSYTQSNTPVAKFTLAVDRPKRDGQENGADFIRITVWGKQAENCDRYLGKGRQAAIMGRITTGSYEKNGERVYTTDVTADRVEFLGGGEKKITQAQAEEQQSFGDWNIGDSFREADDDCPF